MSEVIDLILRGDYAGAKLRLRRMADTELRDLSLVVSQHVMRLVAAEVARRLGNRINRRSNSGG
jgi:hypothetical protein